MGLLQALGQAKPVSEFINTVGQYQTTQSNLETQKMQQQILQQKMLQEQKDNAEYNVDAVMTLYPEHIRPQIKELLTISGKVSPNGIVRGKDMREVPNLLAEYPKVAMGINTADYERLQKETESLRKKGDPESLAKALQNVKEMTDLENKIRFLRGEKKDDKLQGIDPKMDVYQDGKLIKEGNAQKEAKGRMIPIFDPSSPTEYFYGDPSTGEMTEMAAPPPKSSVEKDTPFNSWKESFIESKGRKPSPNEVMEWHRAGGVNINFDKDIIKGAIKTLPGLKEKAKSSNNGIVRIDRMLDLINKGAGGRVGQVKAWLAPTLEAFGYKSQGLAEAQMYETLAKTLGGSMRMEIVGPGVVSDYEQKLLAKVSAGGATATDAAKELLTYYRGIAESNIKDYNETVESVSGESPAATKVYRPIGENKTAPAEKKRYKFNPATGQLE